MPKSLKNRRITLGLVALLACGLAVAEQAAMQLDIAEQRLDRALNAWADQTGYQVLISVIAWRVAVSPLQ